MSHRMVGGVRAHVEGVVARDVEVRASKAGKPWAAVRVKVEAPGFPGADEHVLYVTAKVFGVAAESLRGVREGSPIKLRGCIGIERPWTDRSGKERPGGLEVLVHAVDEVGTPPTAAEPEPSMNQLFDGFDGAELVDETGLPF